jgi:hypothetical protein
MEEARRAPEQAAAERDERVVVMISAPAST